MARALEQSLERSEKLDLLTGKRSVGLSIQNRIFLCSAKREENAGQLQNNNSIGSFASMNTEEQAFQIPCSLLQISERAPMINQPISSSS